MSCSATPPAEATMVVVAVPSWPGAPLRRLAAVDFELALLAVLLGCGCSLTFYGVKEIKDEPKPKAAVACVEPRPPKAPIAATTPFSMVAPSV